MKGKIIFATAIIAMMLVGPILIQTASAGIFSTTINAQEVTTGDKSQKVYHSNAIHGVRSFQSTFDSSCWITASYIQRRSTWWSDDALLQGYISLSSSNVKNAYSNNACLINQYDLQLYHYAPTDGSHDGNNEAGWVSPYSYVSVNYNIPNGMSNHIYRTGAYMSNNVYKDGGGSITWGDASAWEYANAVNAISYNTGSSGNEVTAYVYSYTWEETWDWWHWVYSYDSKSDYFYINY